MTDSSLFTILPATSADAREALELVLSRLAPEQRRELAADALANAQQPPAGLFTARNMQRAEDSGQRAEATHPRPLGAVWAQLQPGATAIVWPPVVIEGCEQAAAPLLDAAVGFLRQHRVGMAQALLDPEDQAAAAWLEAAAFRPLADLDYLASLSAAFPVSEPASVLAFESYSPDHHARFASVVQQTYAQTRDCPELNGVRRIDEVLAGYRATGVFDARHWLLAHHEERDVGCLLLAAHPDLDQMELVYLGVVPEARGQGYGSALVRRAQWLTRRAGLARLVLAVDQRNQYALDIYAAAGFVAWARRRALVLSHADTSSDASTS